MSEENIVFLLGDKLPLVSESVITIVSYAPGGAYTEKNETKKRKHTVNNYVSALIEQWSNAFGSKYVMARKSVVNILRKHIVSYGGWRCSRASTFSASGFTPSAPIIMTSVNTCICSIISSIDITKSACIQ